eukprot:6448454-Lingulodinium_polyedra.AAC.1
MIRSFGSGDDIDACGYGVEFPPQLRQHMMPCWVVGTIARRRDDTMIRCYDGATIRRYDDTTTR